jgi:hypothetical protein
MPTDFNATVPADAAIADAPLVIERTSPVPEPALAAQAFAADTADLPIVGAQIVSVERSGLEDAIVDPPTIDMPTTELPKIPREAFEAPQPSAIEKMLADVPPPPPEPQPIAVEPAPAPAGPFAPITPAIEPAAEPLPAEPPPSFASDSPSKFADETPATSERRKSSVLPYLLVALLVLVAGVAVVLCSRKTKPPFPGATGRRRRRQPDHDEQRLQPAAAAATDAPTALPPPRRRAQRCGDAEARWLPKRRLWSARRAGVILSKGKSVGETGRRDGGNQSYSFGKKLPNRSMQMGVPRRPTCLQKVTTVDPDHASLPGGEARQAVARLRVAVHRVVRPARGGDRTSRRRDFGARPHCS